MKRNSVLLAAALLCIPLVTADVQNDTHGEYPSFLTVGDMPDATAYLPAPPDTASPLFCSDRAMYEAGKILRSTPRGSRAAADAQMHTDSILSGFSAAVRLPLSAAESPETHLLISKVETDASNATVTAKRHYMRKRPFVQFGEPTLIPAGEPSHRGSGSYPSSHAAIGWAVALVLSEVCPDCQNAILKRGYDYGQSRVIAGYHYQSDVEAARLAAAAAVARLHADKGFRRQLAKAHRECRRLVKEHKVSRRYRTVGRGCRP